MKFFVKRKERTDVGARSNIRRKTWKPQYFRSGEDVAAKRDSVRCPILSVSLASPKTRRRGKVAGSVRGLTINDDPEKLWERALGRTLALGAG